MKGDCHTSTRTQFCGSINMISPADLIGNGFGEFLTVWFIGIKDCLNHYNGHISYVVSGSGFP